MAMKAREINFSAWIFLIGIILAVMVGIFTTLIPIPSLSRYSAQLYGLLILLGILVGAFMKVNGKESQTFLITATILVIVSKFGMESVRGSLIGIGLGDAVSSIFGALLVLFLPTTIIVALKTLFSISKV